MARTPQTSTAAGRLQRARLTLRSLGDTIAEKQTGCNHLADRLGWDHPEVKEALADVRFWQRQYTEQRRQIRMLESMAEQEAQDLARFTAARAEAFAAWQASGGTGRFMFYADKQQLSTRAAAQREQDVVNHRRLRAQRAAKGA